MRLHYIRWSVASAILLMLSLMLSGPASARAQSNSGERRVTWQLPSLTRADTLRLVGYQPATTLRFTLPANWQPSTDGQLTVAYRVSPATLEGPAYRRPRGAQPGPTLFMRLNEQTPVTAPITSEAATHTFVLPAEYLRAGPNQIELSVFLPLKDDPQCLIANHPDRWFELDAGTEVALVVMPSTDEPTLAEFPWQFAPIDHQTPPPITFVVPDEPNDAELQVLSSVVTAIAHNLTTPPTWDVQAESTFLPSGNSGPVVLIGDTRRNRHVAAAAPEGELTTGWLSLARPTWAENFPVLVVGGPDSQAVADAAAALLDPASMGQASASTLFVAASPPAELFQPSHTFTLADLGYGEEMVQGTGPQSIVYTFNWPVAWSPRNGTLDLRLAHSSKLAWSPAPLAVYLNEQRIANVLFDDPEQSTSTVEIPIPAGIPQPGRNTLRLEFDLSIPPERCGMDTLEGFWASVDPKTTFELPHDTWSGHIDLYHTPYQFTSAVDLANLAIVLPVDSTLADIGQSLPLLRVLAESKARVAPRLVHAETIEPPTEQSHLILLGAPARQPLLHELNPYLPAPLDLSSGTLQRTNALQVPAGQPDAAVVQSLRSPWALDRAVVVATGDTEGAAALAAKLLAEPQAWRDVRGNVAVAPVSSMGAPSPIASQRVANIDAVPGVQSLDRIAKALLGTNSKWLALALPPVAMLLVAAGSVLGLRWDRQRRAKHAGGH